MEDAQGSSLAKCRTHVGTRTGQSLMTAGHRVYYTSDEEIDEMLHTSERACSITADATDGANNVIPGWSSSSALGVYHGFFK